MNEAKFEIMHSKASTGDGGFVPIMTIAYIEDGMVLGASQGSMAQFGKDPTNVTTRAFTSHEYANRWLKVQCKLYAGREDVDFVERTEESPLVIPVDRSLSRHRGRM